MYGYRAKRPLTADPGSATIAAVFGRLRIPRVRKYSRTEATGDITTVVSKTSTKKASELDSLKAKVAELEAKLAAKPVGKGRVHNSEFLVPAEYVAKMSSADLWKVADFMVARDAAGNKVKGISKKGNNYNKMAEGADYGAYTILNSIASQKGHGKDLSEAQINTVRGILSDLVRADIIDIKK